MNLKSKANEVHDMESKKKKERERLHGWTILSEVLGDMHITLYNNKVTLQ